MLFMRNISVLLEFVAIIFSDNDYIELKKKKCCNWSLLETVVC